MEVLITLDDAVVAALLELMDETSPSRAVEVAIERLVRDYQFTQLRQLKGEVTILSNEELEQAYAEAAAEVDFGWDAVLMDGLADEEGT
jgi:Arc/MetJ family transcription regulator